MKSEKEKMLAGEIYDCACPELLSRWHLAKKLQKEFADTPSDDRERLTAILDELLGSRGEHISGKECRNQHELRLPRLQYDYNR